MPIGSAELLDHVEGRTSLEECRSRWLANTRAYAKRQLTWFRARPEALFLPCEGAGEPLLARARRFLDGLKDA